MPARLRSSLAPMQPSRGRRIYGRTSRGESSRGSPPTSSSPSPLRRPPPGRPRPRAAGRGRSSAGLAAKFFQPFPETVIAVTGTNGKTSNVELTRQLWRTAGNHAASLGTLGVTTADDQVTTGLTTPDIVTFLSNLAGPARMGIRHAALAGRTHATPQYRTEGLPVRAA